MGWCEDAWESMREGRMRCQSFRQQITIFQWHHLNRPKWRLCLQSHTSINQSFSRPKGSLLAISTDERSSFHRSIERSNGRSGRFATVCRERACITYSIQSIYLSTLQLEKRLMCSQRWKRAPSIPVNQRNVCHHFVDLTPESWMWL